VGCLFIMSDTLQVLSLGEFKRQQLQKQHPYMMTLNNHVQIISKFYVRTCKSCWICSGVRLIWAFKVISNTCFTLWYINTYYKMQTVNAESMSMFSIKLYNIFLNSGSGMFMGGKGGGWWWWWWWPTKQTGHYNRTEHVWSAAVLNLKPHTRGCWDMFHMLSNTRHKGPRHVEHYLLYNFFMALNE
jgi:hypothetical protein